jgi:LacI family transcriptional regulator
MSARGRSLGAVSENVTLADVARQAGVSLSTAPRAVNGNANRAVSEVVSRRVRRVADDLGYVRDAGAQSIARGRTSTIGLIVFDFAEGDALSAMHHGVRAAEDAESLGVLVMSADGDWARLPGLVREMQRLRVRGLVAVTLAYTTILWTVAAPIRAARWPSP